MPVRTVGIDLAAQPANTGLCTIDWPDGEVVVWANSVSGGGDHELVDAVCGPTVAMAGIDAPLGWPDDFVAAVVAHHGHGPWPDQSDSTDHDTSGDHRRRLRLRLTDTAVTAATGRHPMSVSADRIAVAAMRAARLQDLVVRRCGDPAAVDRSGASGRVAEVYPAAALAVWGVDPTGYKGPSPQARQRRASVLAAVARRAGLGVSGEVADAVTTSDHLLDAVVCAVVARAVVDAGTVAAAARDVERARREGWIHVPDPLWVGPNAVMD